MAVEDITMTPSRDEERGSATTQTLTKPPISMLKTFGVIAACTLAMMNNIQAGIALTVALPTVGEDLGIPEANLQWVISAYSLTSGCFLLLFGRLADLHGRKLVFLLGAVWLCIWSIACGFAPNEIALDVMRALQGLGPAAAVPAGLGILAQTFEMGSVRRTIAFATFSSGAPIGAAFGNVMGSVLTQFTKPSWKAPFYFTAGLAALTFVIAMFAIDKDTHHLDPALDRRVDWVGAALITSGLVLLTFALGDGETAPQGWKTGYIIGLLILSVILIGAFIYWEHVLGNDKLPIPFPSSSSASGLKRRHAPPLLNLELFTRAKGRMAVMLLVAFFVWAGFSSWLFYAILYYQSYLGLTPVLTMIRILPMSVTGICCNVIVALAVARVQGIFLVVIGCTMTGLAPLLFALIDVDAPYWAFGFPAAIVAVFGADFIFAGGSLYVAKVSLPHEQSVAGGLFNTVTQVGLAIGLAISSVVLDKTAAKKARELGAPVPPAGSTADIPKEALLAAYRAVQWLNFAFVMVGLCLSLIFLRKIGVIARKRVVAVIAAESEDVAPSVEGVDPPEILHEKSMEGLRAQGSAVSTIIVDDDHVAQEKETR